MLASSASRPELEVPHRRIATAAIATAPRRPKRPCRRAASCPATGSPGGAALSRSAASSVLPLLNLSSAQASSELSCFARERRSGVGARPRLLRERRVRLSDVDGRAGDRSSFNAVTRCLDGDASLCAKLTLQSVLSTQPTIVRGGGRGVSRASEWKTLRAGTWAPGFVLGRARRRG